MDAAFEVVAVTRFGETGEESVVDRAAPEPADALEVVERQATHSSCRCRDRPVHRGEPDAASSSPRRELLAAPWTVLEGVATVVSEAARIGRPQCHLTQRRRPIPT